MTLVLFLQSKLFSTNPLTYSLIAYYFTPFNTPLYTGFTGPVLLHSIYGASTNTLNNHIEKQYFGKL
jgi:hypothetical protein